MKHTMHRDSRKQLTWGVILIAIGAAFLLDRAGWLEISQFWQYWPFLIVVFGLVQVIGYRSARDLTGGLWLVVVGLWLYVSTEELFGLGFHNSWPILIIAWGAGMVVEPLIQKHLSSPMEQDHEQ
ncbi:MAG: DUF5668 domain-containing protein [Pseudomonadota bacterium]